MPEMTAAIAKESDLRSNFFEGEALETLYFGGGTPSAVPHQDIDYLIRKMRGNFDIQDNAEITLEANPEDVTTENLDAWAKSGVNRLSIGIQSLQDKELQWMNRNHHAERARNCVEDALKAGIRSVNVDLIYGSPLLDNHDWKLNLDWAFGCGADHISAYGLTVEPGTLLYKKVQKAVLPDVDENIQASQYEILYHTALQQGWDFYEISNLSKPGHRAKHNSNYWKNKPYLGLGPSAHSFTGKQRSWNVRDNKKYVEALDRGELPLESEILTEKDLYNEFVMTRLRMSEGFGLEELDSFKILAPKNFQAIFSEWRSLGYLQEDANRVSLSLKGRLICDTLTTDLMI